MTDKTLSTRRSFLKAVGAAAAALPFYKMLENNVVYAATGALPQKFVGVAFPHAKPAAFYSRRSGETDTSYDISYADCALKPFDDAATYGESFKAKTTIFEGFGYGVGQGGGGGDLYVNFHGAMGILLTGSAAQSGSGTDFKMQNASLDQFLAAQYGGATRFRSVEMAADGDSVTDSSASIAYGPGGQVLSRMISPEAVWNKFFAGFTPPSTDPTAAAAAARKLAIGTSVLDYVANDITRLNARLAGSEKQKLDQHLTVVRDLEKRLGAAPPPVLAGCQPPPLHSTGAATYSIANYWNNGAPWFDLVIDYQIELLAQILNCDLARFATLVLPTTSGPGTASYAKGTDLPLPVDFHNDIAHVSEDSPQGAINQASMCRYYYGKVAKLMRLLSQGGALDSTLILVGSEGGHGEGHSWKDAPLILAGGANGAMQMGRRIVCPGRVAVPGDECAGNDLTAHNAILVAIANAFGANLGSFGTCAANPAFTKAISGLI